MSSTASVATKLITPAAILSYPWLDEAQPPLQEGGKSMFSAVLIFDPNTMEKYAQFGTTLDALKAAATVAAQEKFGDKLPALLRNPNFKSGIRTDVEEKPGYPAGSVFINARNERRPGLVYLWPNPADHKPMIVPEDKITEAFYPGAIVRASVRAFGFDKGGNKGVSFALNNLQLIDGKAPRLDNRKAAEDDFEADASAKPASLADLGVDQ